MHALNILGKCIVLPSIIKEKTAFQETIASSITMRKTALVSRSVHPFSGMREDPSIIYAN